MHAQWVQWAVSLSAPAAYSCWFSEERILHFTLCIFLHVSVVLSSYESTFALDLWVAHLVHTEKVARVIKALRTWVCGGRCPGSGTVMDSMACQSLGSLLASGTEVALLNTALPRLSPNTTAYFKVNCLCGAASSPPRVTRLLALFGTFITHCQRVCFRTWGWLAGALPRAGTQKHTQCMSTQPHIHWGKKNLKPALKKQQKPTTPIEEEEQTPVWSCFSPGSLWQAPYLNVPSLKKHPNLGVWSQYLT